MDTKVDFKKSMPSYKAKLNTPELVEVPPMQYLMLDGEGDPNSDDFQVALEALYPISYKLKFASKKELNRDYTVPPLEALWWADDMSAFTSQRDKTEWQWTAMLMTPEWITQDLYAVTRDSVIIKKMPLRADEVRLAPLDEGLCVQALHTGSYDDEGPLLEQIHNEFIPNNNLAMTGKHHEIYLSDPRKTAPEKLKTILRQPVTRAG